MKMKSKNVLTFPLPKQARKTFITKAIAFFQTPEGRTVSHWAIGAAAVGVLAASYLPQTILFAEYRQYFLTPTL